MSRKPPTIIDDGEGLPGPYEEAQTEDLWFLPEEAAEDGPLPGVSPGRLIDGDTWRMAEAALVGELAELAFDAGRLAERLRVMGAGAVQRLALEEAAAQSWWTGHRIGSDRLALWLSYRIGAAEEGGEGLIRTAWAARRLMAKPSGGVVALVADLLGDVGPRDMGQRDFGLRDPALPGEVAEVLEDVAGRAAMTRGCAAFHLWRSLEERPDHLRGLEAAVLGARLAGQGGLPFLPLALTGFGALTASGDPQRRLTAWVEGAHRAVLSALMALERLAQWLKTAEAKTADLQGRTPARLIAALAAHPMLGAAQAEAETGASRASVQRNLDLLETRGLVREVTGQGRFRIWAARL